MCVCVCVYKCVLIGLCIQIHTQKEQTWGCQEETGLEEEWLGSVGLTDGNSSFHVQTIICIC